MRIAVIADLHVSASGEAPAPLVRLVPQLVALRPRLVVLAGDATSGNRDDGHSLANPRRRLLEPVRLDPRKLAHATSVRPPVHSLASGQ